MSNQNKKPLQSILLAREVAEILRVGEEHVRNLIRQGKIKAYKEGRRGGFRIMREEVDRYVRVRHQEVVGRRGK